MKTNKDQVLPQDPPKHQVLPQESRERYTEIEKRFREEYKSDIEIIYNDTKEKLKADGGFVGYEDIDHYIQLAVKDGTFYLLEHSDGFTGHVYNRLGRTTIYDPVEHNYLRKDNSDNSSEIVSVLEIEGSKVGVIYFESKEENKFNQKDADILTQSAKMISDIIGRQQPWPLRKWYVDEFYENLISKYINRLDEQLEKEFNEENHILRISTISKNDSKLEQRKLVATSKVEKSYQDLSNVILSTGKAADNTTDISNANLMIPFPVFGSIKGAITVDIYQVEPLQEFGDGNLDRNLTNKTIKEVENRIFQEIRSIPFSYFDEINFTNPYGAFYSLFYFASNIRYTFFNKIEKILEKSKMILNTSPKLYLLDDFFFTDRKDKIDFLKILSSIEFGDLLKEFPVEHPEYFRPRVIKNKHHLYSIIHYRCIPIGVFTINFINKIEASYNFQFIQLITEQIEEIIAIHSSENAELKLLKNQGDFSELISHYINSHISVPLKLSRKKIKLTDLKDSLTQYMAIPWKSRRRRKFNILLDQIVEEVSQAWGSKSNLNTHYDNTKLYINRFPEDKFIESIFFFMIDEIIYASINLREKEWQNFPFRMQLEKIKKLLLFKNK